MKKIILKVDPIDRELLMQAILRVRMVFMGYGDFGTQWLGLKPHKGEVASDSEGLAQQLMAEMLGLT